MPLYLALLTSFTFHAALIVVPTLLAAKPPSSPVPRIEARLLPLPAPTAAAEAVSTESGSLDAMPEQHAAKPRSLHDASLRRAQAALSRHLFYPQQAIAMGLEGEVILLLSLTQSGQLVSAAIARSSGHALLDEAALDAARRIGALPGNPRQVLFPVNFRLQ